jgi:TolB-like protein
LHEGIELTIWEMGGGVMMAGMMRAILAFCFAAMAIPAVVFGDANAARPVRVAVLPFDVVGDTGHEWIGHALQEGLATGLEKGSQISAVIVPGIVPADEAAAIATAKKLDADVVIIGSVQVVEQTIRARGRMISVWTGETLGVLQNDSSVRGLFETEDLLADRAVRILTATKRVEPKKTAPATIDVVGPTVASAGPRYFDGDIQSVIAKPARFGDDYDRYYYHSYPTSGCSYSSGYYGYCGSWGGCFGAAGCAGNGVLFPIAAPTRGW